MKTKCYLPLLSAILLFSSCSQLIYVTNKQNVTLFQEKDEMEFNLVGGMGDKASSLEIQGAYSFTDHIALQGNASTWLGADLASGSIVEIAPGYFTKVDKDFVFEIYGGYSRGKSYLDSTFYSNRASTYHESIDINYDRYFIQPAFGYTSKFVDFIFSSRIGLVDFYGHKPIVILGDDLNTFSYEKMNQLMTFEPALTFRAGLPNVKFQMQAIYILPFESRYKGERFYQSFYMNFSLLLSFGGHFMDFWHRDNSNPDYGTSARQ